MVKYTVFNKNFKGFPSVLGYCKVAKKENGFVTVQRFISCLYHIKNSLVAYREELSFENYIMKDRKIREQYKRLIKLSFAAVYAFRIMPALCSSVERIL